jgi:hypothetical protein
VELDDEDSDELIELDDKNSDELVELEDEESGRFVELEDEESAELVELEDDSKDDELEDSIDEMLDDVDEGMLDNDHVDKTSDNDERMVVLEDCDPIKDEPARSNAAEELHVDRVGDEELQVDEIGVVEEAAVVETLKLEREPDNPTDEDHEADEDKTDVISKVVPLERLEEVQADDEELEDEDKDTDKDEDEDDTTTAALDSVDVVELERLVELQTDDVELGNKDEEVVDGTKLADGLLEELELRNDDEKPIRLETEMELDLEMLDDDEATPIELILEVLVVEDRFELEGVEEM